jgi:hypothetical protein
MALKPLWGKSVSGMYVCMYSLNKIFVDVFYVCSVPHDSAVDLMQPRCGFKYRAWQFFLTLLPSIKSAF